MKKLKILVTNDDGITAPGIYALAKELQKIADVTVVAPLTEQSAVGHAITMKNPLRLKDIIINNEFFGYAFDGTPADCVKMGIRNILKEKPDLVISGINNGANTAINIIYSGTVSGAREAAIMDVPSIAVSVTSHEPKTYDIAAQIAAEYAIKVFKNPLPNGTLLNINVPNCSKEEIKGHIVTKQGKSKWDDEYEERIDPMGKKYYWLKGDWIELDNSIDFDHFATQQNYVSLTPIHFDLTDYENLTFVKKYYLD
ncbi:MAG TPA: 5'/3'-nucleotidase SurE [Ignavibacteriales bacterium]|nr:5'/3'-nucleotidase SurE [Ignavibacteriales bacterium]HPD66883.1 5'/3'-nucleotidase SurE [Ignavibacteriales bacterium]HPP33774.1 5'/3'-nucleotidase SurE [Ignavibacteriales bacterium]HRR18610.1 5'/3'-nucleotidase SurE [Ignavibacteriales bacterium]HRT98265.1 5'/3'-nucleotidase SurE [Ignavibacteriales bacterium]